MTEEDPPPVLASSPQIDTSVSHSARICDYWLGGRGNYPVDREVGDRIAEMLPGIVTHARADRMFLGRVVRFLAWEAGIRQFLDIGAGLPTVDNTHEVAQRVAPDCRVLPLAQDHRERDHRPDGTGRCVTHTFWGSAHPHGRG